MKKLFIIIILLCFFIIPKKTFALTFNDCNNVEHNVVDDESVRDYYYFTYYQNQNSINLFSMTKSQGSSVAFQTFSFEFPLDSAILVYNNSSNFKFQLNNNGSLSTSNCSYYSLPLRFNYTNNEYDSNGNPTIIDNSSCGRIYSLPLYHPNIYDYNNNLSLKYESNYSINDILQKYNCNGSSEPEEPETDEEVNMFNVVETFLIQFINILPFIIPFILIMNLICRILFNERS